ncbi:hypothetical protein H7171_00585 [Candidatus Saccharibacteria bacterium]|nr:hypothetical protein [Candidatus Saccharibacteria bacterium]
MNKKLVIIIGSILALLLIVGGFIVAMNIGKIDPNTKTTTNRTTTATDNFKSVTSVAIDYTSINDYLTKVGFTDSKVKSSKNAISASTNSLASYFSNVTAIAAFTRGSTDLNSVNPYEVASVGLYEFASGKKNVDSSALSSKAADNQIAGLNKSFEPIGGLKNAKNTPAGTITAKTSDGKIAHGNCNYVTATAITPKKTSSLGVYVCMIKVGVSAVYIGTVRIQYADEVPVQTAVDLKLLAQNIATNSTIVAK